MITSLAIAMERKTTKVEVIQAALAKLNRELTSSSLRVDELKVHAGISMQQISYGKKSARRIKKRKSKRRLKTINGGKR